MRPGREGRRSKAGSEDSKVEFVFLVSPDLKINSFVKSRISPPLVGGDKGEGDITT